MRNMLSKIKIKIKYVFVKVCVTTIDVDWYKKALVEIYAGNPGTNMFLDAKFKNYQWKLNPEA